MPRLPSSQGAGTFQYDALGNIRQHSVAARNVRMSCNPANPLSAYTDSILAILVPSTAATCSIVSTQRKTAQAIRSKIGYECEYGRRDQTLDSEA
jgi:hypothetical protein